MSTCKQAIAKRRQAKFDMRYAKMGRRDSMKRSARLRQIIENERRIKASGKASRKK